MKSNKKLIVGNWKMSPKSLREAKKTFDDFKKQKYSSTNVTIVFCPPDIYFNDLKRMYRGTKIFFGVQNIFWKSDGSYTGQVSPEMVKDVGARFVIIGHSERRELGVNNEMVAQKTKAALKIGLHVILCIGEPERDEKGEYLKFIEKELKESLRGVGRNLISKLSIAYEPIWAIGKGKKAMNPYELHQMTIFIRKILISIYGRKAGSSVPILYGGSVDSYNARSIVYEGEVDGLLVGRASLNPHEFSKIIDVVSKK